MDIFSSVEWFLNSGCKQIDKDIHVYGKTDPYAEDIEMKTENLDT